MTALQLAKAGWCDGDPDLILEKPTERVIEMLFYEIFLREYEDTAIEINREDKK